MPLKFSNLDIEIERDRERDINEKKETKRMKSDRTLYENLG